MCIESIQKTESDLVVSVVSTSPTSCCPLCAWPSSAVHSYYHRSVRDVPCGGQSVQLALTVRKFFCRNAGCQRKIFTERLPTFVEPWAKMTVRLSAEIQAIGLATSGSLGTRLSARLGICTSWMTILRRIMELPTPAAGSVVALGIDDFSFRRGRKFGTILVDLDAHAVIDVLAERSSQTAADWMRQHPEIDYVSRDRGKDYTQGASEGAPQAIQVADRFHLMKNFVEALEPEVSRCYRHLRQTHSPLPAPELPTPEEWRQVPDADVVRKRRARQASKQERFEQVKDLFSQGVAVKEIGGQLGMSVRTVYRWLDREECPAHQPEPKEQTDRLERFAQAKALRLHGLSQQEIAERLAIGVRTVQRWQARETCPYSQPRRKRRSIFDPYAAYVLSRWQQGERSVSLLWQEIQNQGFSGSIQTLYRYVRALRQDSASLPAPGVADGVAVQKAIWLIARPYERLKAEERTDLQALCQVSQELATLHRLSQSFGQIVRKREGDRLGEWMKQVKESHFRDVKRFAAGLERDQEEILSGLTLVYSNGQVEGQINKLKLIKRQGYGRAGFSLLRQRVLHAL
ncbi:MAG TPA: ISL3 family transposase [Ktedonobacteraceae bacterium]|nr:ISL3 family transposase [Ktedonobacteraceae bacterium]